MSRWISVIVYGALFGGLVLIVCTTPPWQYVGVALLVVALILATVETHWKYHPRQER